MHTPYAPLPRLALLVGLALGCPRPPVTSTAGSQGDPTLLCARDADCVVSCVRRDRCCDQLCDCTNVYTQGELRRLEEDHRARCQEPCPVASCVEPSERTVARCLQGRCEGHQEPVAHSGK